MSATDDGPGHSYGPGGLGMNGQETDFDTETEGEDTTNGELFVYALIYHSYGVVSVSLT